MHQKVSTIANERNIPLESIALPAQLTLNKENINQNIQQTYPHPNSQKPFYSLQHQPNHSHFQKAQASMITSHFALFK